MPVDLNRLNGSNGNVSFAASGLPTGMSASFSRNPLAGTGTRTILTLSAAEGAAPRTSTRLSPSRPRRRIEAGNRARVITKQVRIRENCDRTMRADYLDARSEDCMRRRNGHWEATNTTVRVNGLVIRPADDSRPTLVIDPRNNTVKGRELTMPFRVSLASDPEVPIYAGPSGVGLLRTLRPGRRPPQRHRVRPEGHREAQGPAPLRPISRSSRAAKPADADAQARLPGRSTTSARSPPRPRSRPTTTTASTSAAST